MSVPEGSGGAEVDMDVDVSEWDSSASSSSVDIKIDHVCSRVVEQEPDVIIISDGEYEEEGDDDVFESDGSDEEDEDDSTSDGSNNSDEGDSNGIVPSTAFSCYKGPMPETLYDCYIIHLECGRSKSQQTNKLASRALEYRGMLIEREILTEAQAGRFWEPECWKLQNELSEEEEVEEEEEEEEELETRTEAKRRRTRTNTRTAAPAQPSVVTPVSNLLSSAKEEKLRRYMASREAYLERKRRKEGSKNGVSIGGQTSSTIVEVRSNQTDESHSSKTLKKKKRKDKVKKDVNAAVENRSFVSGVMFTKCLLCDFKWKNETELRFHRDQKHPRKTLFDLMTVVNRRQTYPTPEQYFQIFDDGSCLQKTVIPVPEISKKRKRKESKKQKTEDVKGSTSKGKKKRIKTEIDYCTGSNKSGKEEMKQEEDIEPEPSLSPKETFLDYLGLISCTRLASQSPKKPPIRGKICYVKVEVLRKPIPKSGKVYLCLNKECTFYARTRKAVAIHKKKIHRAKRRRRVSSSTSNSTKTVNTRSKASSTSSYANSTSTSVLSIATTVSSSTTTISRVQPTTMSTDPTPSTSRSCHRTSTSTDFAVAASIPVRPRPSISSTNLNGYRIPRQNSNSDRIPRYATGLVQPPALPNHHSNEPALPNTTSQNEPTVPTPTSSYASLTERMLMSLLTGRPPSSPTNDH